MNYDAYLNPEHPMSQAKITGGYQEARNERSDWEAEWRLISDYLLPGRGIYQTYSVPRKRKLTTKKVINTTGEDALYVLTSGMHSGLTSPSRPWFSLGWADSRIQEHEPLKAWLQDCAKKLHAALHSSNFYSIINSFYIEYAGFGTGCTYVGEDSGTDQTPFRFELLTAGEYAFATDATGRAKVFYRTLIKTPRQVVEKYKNASERLKGLVKNNEVGVDVKNVILIECIMPVSFGRMPLTRIVYEVSGGPTASRVSTTNSQPQLPLLVSGFYEFPYPVARWGTIGSDDYGIGPGSRALPHIRRLQEMEKAFLMATHKAIDPPVNAPAAMRNKLNMLPGGRNYYSNPNNIVTEVSSARFDFQGVSAAIERVEQRIQRNFFNDIFLTASRDPNASPLKARQVDAQDQEKMLRLGPVIERLQHEFLQPLLARCFNIMLRKNLFEPLSPELADTAGDYVINMVSPLATAQRGVALNGINTFMSAVGQYAQFDPRVLDQVDPDRAVREIAEVSGVEIGILRPQKDVDLIRKNRAQAEAAQKEEQRALEESQAGATIGLQNEQTRKTAAEAGLINAETTQVRQEAGMV